eukprot:7673202-Prorocentrum_lima.AAC.1
MGTDEADHQQGDRGLLGPGGQGQTCGCLHAGLGGVQHPAYCREPLPGEGGEVMAGQVAKQG